MQLLLCGKRYEFFLWHLLIFSLTFTFYVSVSLCLSVINFTPTIRVLVIDRSSHWRCSVKKLFLEILQNSQEHNCARVSFLIKLQASGSRHQASLLKRRLWYRRFPVNFLKFLRTHFSQNTPGLLLLNRYTIIGHVNMYLVKTNWEKSWHVPCLAEKKETFLRWFSSSVN